MVCSNAHEKLESSFKTVLCDRVTPTGQQQLRELLSQEEAETEDNLARALFDSSEDEDDSARILFGNSEDEDSHASSHSHAPSSFFARKRKQSDLKSSSYSSQKKKIKM